MLELGLTWLFDFIICVNYFRWLCYCDWWMQIDVCVYICSFKLILRSISMQFYTFLETTVVTLCLLPHFIAFFSEGEIPGTPGTLATTFLAFGNLISPISFYVQQVASIVFVVTDDLVALFAVLNLAFALSVLGFLIMHISLVAANTTTIEVFSFFCSFCILPCKWGFPKRFSLRKLNHKLI